MYETSMLKEISKIKSYLNIVFRCMYETSIAFLSSNCLEMDIMDSIY